MDRFDLAPFIKLECRVIEIAPLIKSSDQRWKHRIKYMDDRDAAGGKERTYDCSHIAICTGLHVEPNVPPIPGIENVKGEKFHSSQYKLRSQLTGRNVLILGCGETAMGKAA